ncbi:hypothetical protein DRH29_01665 [candidate division Kazan bacterium]|uniref:Homing endonuclease LAGLIDADG domain-containing protein n=1 Tax=candidate division Kazan bacterium TaxID=2202143 RepID=A0A420ZDB7_UNCK3|nr:MAG: hypothetical protein DRH29_01665 [candidate division Kazan bacterium]
MVSDNVSGADNQQERLDVNSISDDIGYFLSGFALGEGSFMIICRRRSDYRRGWRISAAFNVSQRDREPLELFKNTLRCGTMRKAGNDAWYFEVNSLPEICSCVIPFFDKFPLVGQKAQEFERFKQVANLLAKPQLDDNDYLLALSLRHQMNSGGKRKNSTARILRDYTPNSDTRQISTSEMI